MRELVKNLWQNIVSSPNQVEYQQRLNALDQACVNSSKFVDYYNKTWLTPLDSTTEKKKLIIN
jgi:hypothetical protein